MAGARQIVGMAADGRVLHLVIPLQVGTVESATDPVGYGGSYVPDRNQPITFLSVQARISVTEVTADRAKGTFEFVADGFAQATGAPTGSRVMVTDGVFDVALTPGGGLPPAASVGTMSARVNGQLFSMFASTATIPGTEQRHIVGATEPEFGTGPTLGLTIEPFHGVGSYTLGEGSHRAVGSRFFSALNVFSTDLGGSGTVFVTEFSSSRVRGTFSFSALTPLGETFTVTEGQFDVPRESP